jgi:hypothetical protein
MNKNIKTPDEWLKMDDYSDITILDPDGWDRNNFDESWNEKITEEEFNRKLCSSTCMWSTSRFHLNI